MKLLRVAHLVPHDGIGGVESAARSMLGHDHSLEFRLFYLSGGVKKIVEGADHQISNGPERHSLNPLSQASAFRRILDFQPDVLVCSLWKSVAVSVAIRSALPSCKLVAFLHVAEPTHFLDVSMHRLLLKKCDAVWADSDATLAERLTEYEVNKVTRKISFVTQADRRVSERVGVAPAFVFWGRLHAQKGIDRAIDFIAKLHELGVPATFDLWGPDGGELSLLKLLVERRNLNDWVSFLGPATAEDIACAAAENHFFLQFSHYEGMSMAVVEAMQYGLVPVVTPVGEIAHYCQPDRAVILNSFADVGKALQLVLELIGDDRRYTAASLRASGYWRDHTEYKEDFIAAALELLR